MFELASCWVYI